MSPDGRWAIVSNNEQSPAAPSALPPGSSNVLAGYSLAVVDTRTLRVASVYGGAGASFFEGVAAVNDAARPGRTLVLASGGSSNLVRTFDLSGDGTLSPLGDGIPVAGFPGALAVSLDGRTAYVSQNLGGSVTAIDLVNRRALGTRAVGYSPNGVAVSSAHAYVTNGGLSTYGPLSQPVPMPEFANPQSSDRSSSLSTLNIGLGGGLDASDSATPLRMDPAPDGTNLVGSARPGAIVARRDGQFAYVAMENVDRIATVALRGEPRVVAGLDLRLFVNAPYGTQPSAEVLSRDGKRLYVALAGLNAVAVLDARNPAQLHRLGLIPTGWYPSALALSPDGRYLYVTDAKGVDGWGLLQRIDMKTLPLIKVTLSALRYNRNVASAAPNAAVPPLRSGVRSNVIDRIVYIAVGDSSFDAVFGPAAQSDTPNLRALARTYGLADNFYVDDMNIDANRQFSLGGVATLYAQRTLHVNAGRAPFDAHASDPEDYARAGYVFNGLARAGISFRDYGALLDLSGFQPAPATKPRSRGRYPAGLGGSYTLAVPALAVLDGAVAPNFPGWNPSIPNAARAQAFIDDMGPLVQSDRGPALTYIWLPASASAGGMADADRALGKIVEFLSHTPHWSSTAVFVVGDGIDAPSDSVNRARSYAVVVSPLAKRGYVGHAHLSVASVLKTEEELLGLQPLALPDLLSTDMADFLGAVPYPSPYQAIP